MEQDKFKNVIFIVLGVILLGIVELKLFELSNTLKLILGLIGFVALVEGAFELYKILRKEHEQEEN